MCLEMFLVNRKNKNRKSHITESLKDIEPRQKEKIISTIHKDNFKFFFWQFFYSLFLIHNWTLVISYVRCLCMLSWINILFYFHFCAIIYAVCCLVASVMSDSVQPHRLALQAPLSMPFSRQEYLSGLPCPLPGKLPIDHWNITSIFYHPEY